MYDAIVIGARCAGAATAMLLARRGLDVLLVDRARFPSDIPHGHFIHRHGPRRLADWGLLDRVLETGCPRVTEFTSDFGDFELTGRELEVDGIPMGLGPRRTALDAILVEAAARAGAEVREGMPVRELTFDGDRVTGFKGAQGRIVIGADGRNSAVAKQVDAPLTHSYPAISIWYFSYWSGVPGSGLAIHVRDRTAIFAFPTNDGLYGVFIAWPLSELNRVRADIERAMFEVLDGVPALGERVRAGRREDRLAGATQLPNFVRKPHGPGWALVGDAGCHKDPFMALGVCDAFRDAELLADALAGDEPLEHYERRRDEATLPDFERNFGAAHLVAPPELLAMRQSLRGDQDATNRFFMAYEGML
jgi:flavin-dependent dehydrogenase